ncbi:MAG TPA: FAD:protein FMN transferase [Steroidobacteraceae bacterium]|nr:FAD:protein FMN transferase [Steroidobacteraceae bacterium]
MRVLLGTFVAIEARHPSPSHALAAIEAAFSQVLEVDRRMHPRGTQSDLARINASPPRERTRVHAATADLLKLARTLASLTHGVFDPCLPCRPGRLCDLELIEEPDGIHDVVCHREVALDFGGFAKGYAVDRAIAVLRAFGCSAALVNAGGDLRLFGSHCAPVLLRQSDGSHRSVALTDAALAVSDCDSRQRPPEHQGYYNRAAGSGAPLNRFAAVAASEAVVADALVKCVMLCPQSDSDAALHAFGARRIA